MAQTSTADTSHLLTAAEFGDDLDGTLVQSRLGSLFKPLKTIVFAIIQILLNIALLSESIFLLRFTNYCKTENATRISEPMAPSDYRISCTSIMAYSSILVWILTWIIKEVFRTFHNWHRRTGYLKLYHKVEHISEIPFATMTIGNILLMVAMTLRMDEHLPTELVKGIDETPFWLSLQLICCAEFVVIVITMIIYIVKVAKFNKSRADPDVFQTSSVSSMTIATNARTTIEVGPGVRVVPQEVARLQRVCDRQADLLEYLRHRCDVLAGRLYQVSNAQADA